mmetsp:Transcript_5871/g.14521  ORF Transcript_5871/g.14521 Transcript_5871/m.14521 type:complete len:233 (-) Transcript_5871:1889-2587(-)
MKCCLASALAASADDGDSAALPAAAASPTEAPSLPFSGSAGAAGVASAALDSAGGAEMVAAALSEAGFFCCCCCCLVAFLAAFDGFCWCFAAFWAASSAALVRSSRARRACDPQSWSSPISAKTSPFGMRAPPAGGAACGSEIDAYCPAAASPVAEAVAAAALARSRRRRRKSLRSISIATCGLYAIIGDLSAPPRSQNAKPACLRNAASAKAKMNPGCKLRYSRSKKRVAT